jgi:hypothetical protein
MKPVAQEDDLGCAVACVAFILQITYSEALELFEDGERRVKSKANFYCPEIVTILNSNGLHYSWNKLEKTATESEITNLSIVFVKKSKKLPYGHFLCKYQNQWMDPWINLPDIPIKGGFKNSTSGIPTYIIFPIVTKL